MFRHSTQRQTGLIVSLTVIAASAFMPQQAEARSRAAQYVLDQHIAELCSGGGRFRSRIDGISLIEERDLTGDGQNDLVFDSRGIECNDGTGLMGCGPAACNVYFYVRRDGLLKPAGDAFSVGFSVRGGKRTRIELQDRKFENYSVRWNGSAFE